MITSAEIFSAVKRMSQRTLGTRPRLLLTDIATSLGVSPDIILVLLVELENRGLVQIHKATVVSVSLTNYGVSQENVSGGLNSQ